MATRRGTHRRAWGWALCLTLCITATLATPAQADTDEVIVPTMLVLDASGSMRATDGASGGVTRMDAAKRAATELVKQLPDTAPLGLTVYGARTGNKKSDKAAGCTDIEVKAPVAAGQKPELTAAIASVSASGYTPIGEALRVASAALPTAGPRAIVLVSDGIDSCAPPAPCDVAKELKATGVDLAIHAIGFRVDPDARAQLTCIAEETGGTYSDARDEDELRDQLVIKATRTLQGYIVSGKPVTGSAAPDQAPELTPGHYLDSIDASLGDKRVKHYRVKVPSGARLHASATLVPPPGNRGVFAPSVTSLTVELANRQGAFLNELSGNSGDAWTGSAPVTGWASSPPASGEAEVIVTIKPLGTLPAKPQPLEVTIAIEPAWSGTQRPAATPAPSEPALTPGAVPDQEVLAGRSFTAPTVLTPGTHLVKSVPGQVGYFSVPVTFGQRLRWSIHFVDKGEPLRLFDQAKLTVAIFNPVREGVSHDPEAVLTRTDVFAVPGQTTGSGLVSLIRASNRQRAASAPGVASAWLGGDQVIEIHDSLFLAEDTDQAVEPASYLLTVAVDGTPEPGPEVITETTPEELPPVTDDNPDATPPASTTDASAPSTTTSPEPTPDETSPQMPSRIIALVAIGFFIFAFGVVAVVVATRRRKT